MDRNHTPLHTAIAMKIRFKISLDDLIAFEAMKQRARDEDDNWLARNGEGVIWLQMGLLVLIFGAIMLFYVMFSSDLWSRLGGLTLLAFVIAAWFYVRPAAIARRQEKRLRKKLLQDEQTRESLGCTYEMEIDETGLIMGGERGHMVWRWSAIEQIETEEERAFVTHTGQPIRATVIPRFGIIEGDYDDFMYALRVRLNQN